ncbi:hypothetical protein NM688_g9350 [Phlebia brevispora]|uniref:Uncharacterized protein n=1 Tax=Phlebia brevispora TaxID=194682 RepID=A0ACC1RKX6_9APHY|nr:hypothetical protein NM688_g9350 [Phlebia brevispora]
MSSYGSRQHIWAPPPQNLCYWRKARTALSTFFCGRLQVMLHVMTSSMYQLLQQESSKRDWRAQGWHDEENFTSLVGTRNLCGPYYCNGRDPAEVHYVEPFDSASRRRVASSGPERPREMAVQEDRPRRGSRRRAVPPCHTGIPAVHRRRPPSSTWGFHQMFEQVPDKPPYNNDPTGKPQVRDYKLMLALFNDIITTAPAFEEDDLVGFPINAILDWPMGTPAGLAMFTDKRVNAQFRQMFYVWSAFLTSPESRYVLTTDANVRPQ